MAGPDVVQGTVPLQVAAVAQMTLETRLRTGRGGRGGGTGAGGRRGRGGGGGRHVVTFRFGAVVGAVAAPLVCVASESVLVEVHSVDVTDQVLAFRKRGLRARRALVNVFGVRGGGRVGGGRRLGVGRSGRLAAGWRAVQPEYVPVAIRFGRERQRTVFALVRFLAGVRADVPFQRRRPRERKITERAQHPVGGGRIRAHLLPFISAFVLVAAEACVCVAITAGVDAIYK